MSKFKLGALCVLMASASTGVAVAAPCDGLTSSVPAIMPGMPVDLNAVIAQVRNAAPEVRQAALEIRAAQADANQAGRRLNPSIGLEVENFSGSGALTGFDQTETTFSIEQTLQLGGKRSKRERAGRANAALRSAECSAILRETELEAALLFYDLQAKMRLVELAEQSADLASSLETTVFKRVEAGAAAPPELSRARADAAALRAAVFVTRGDVEQTRYELAALWGSAEPVILVSEIHEPTIGDGALSAIMGLSEHPELAVATAHATALRAEQDLAHAIGVPDLTVSAGVRQLQETGDNAFLVGVSIPIPLFNRNRDAARAAGYRAKAKSINRTAVEARLLARQRSAIAQVRAARGRLILLETEALPAAHAAYDASVKGYAAGKFDLTTTLDSRKRLIEAGVAVIDATRTLNSENMRLKSLIGTTPFDGDFQ